MNRVAIVTGGAKPDSIGFAVVKGLRREGCDVVVADLYEQGFAALQDCLCVRTDVADPEAVQRLIDATMNKFSRIDILVNAVGGSWGITEQDLIASPPRGFRGLTNCELSDWRTILAASTIQRARMLVLLGVLRALCRLPRIGPVSDALHARWYPHGSGTIA